MQATIVHDEFEGASLVYLDDRLADVVPWDASWEDRLGAVLETADTAKEYVLAGKYRVLRAEYLRRIPRRALAPVPIDYGWSAEALGEVLGLAIAWTFVMGADFIFGPDGDPFGLF